MRNFLVSQHIVDSARLSTDRRCYEWRLTYWEVASSHLTPSRYLMRQPADIILVCVPVCEKQPMPIKYIMVALCILFVLSCKRLIRTACVACSELNSCEVLLYEMMCFISNWGCRVERLVSQCSLIVSINWIAYDIIQINCPMMTS